MNAALLALLREARGDFVATETLGGPPDRLASDLDELERLGFSLERHPYRGVAYRGPSPRLCPDQIEWGLATERIGRRIAVWDRVSSTNDLAASAARSRANDGLVVLAEGQTAGRGRRGRSWLAPHGSSLLMSVLLFPEGALAEPSWLMALGAVAVAQTIEEMPGLPARIKWPNDVRVGGRKIAGVLVERGAHGAAVVGIGLNVNFGEEDLPGALRDSASSLAILAGGLLDRSELARSLIARLDRLYGEGRRSGPAGLASAWSGRLEPLGREVSVRTSDGEVSGRLVAADLIEGLRVEQLGGEVVAVPHGSIREIDGRTDLL